MEKHRKMLGSVVNSRRFRFLLLAKKVKSDLRVENDTTFLLWS
jgi:hypothetical protein